MYKRFIAGLFWVIVAGNAAAGITIHFEGTAREGSAIDQIVERACAEAATHRWACEPITGDWVVARDAVTARMLAQIEPSGEASSARGVAIYPHDMSDPLYLVFASNRKTKNFVKTQFAGADVHVRVVQLLERLAPLFADLDVDDEGQYWGTHDRDKLVKNLDAVTSGLASVRAKNPAAHGPVRQPDGRILDLVQ